MTKAFRAKLLKAGALDTAKYRYAVYHGHAYDVIKRIKKSRNPVLERRKRRILGICRIHLLLNEV